MSEQLGGSPEVSYFDYLESEHLDRRIVANLETGIIERYSESQRFYHTVEHLEEVVSFLLDRVDQLQNPRVVLWSAMYHDAVYDPALKGGENERRSAALAEAELRGLLPDEEVDLIVSYVLATITHENPNNDPDLALFLDSDMAILGSSSDRYSEYAGAIRHEYSVFSYEAYSSDQGRPALLRMFRQRLLDGTLYQTQFVHQELFDQTLANIDWELAQLESATDPFLS